MPFTPRNPRFRVRDTCPWRSPLQASSKLPPTAKKNIEIIAQVEQELLRNRSWVERFGEGMARFFGSLFFIAVHIAFLTAWISLNTGGIRGIHAFDPYPFAFLALIVAIEFIFLTTFVLINQKHQIRRTEQWWHLHLQLSMLTEQEVTKNMQMLALICHRLGLEEPSEDPELTEMTQATSVTAVVGELERAREVGGGSAAAMANVRAIEKERPRGVEGSTGSGNS